MFRTDMKVGWDCGVNERRRHGSSEHSLDFEEKTTQRGAWGEKIEVQGLSLFLLFVSGQRDKVISQQERRLVI